MATGRKAKLEMVDGGGGKTFELPVLSFEPQIPDTKKIKNKLDKLIMNGLAVPATVFRDDDVSYNYASASSASSAMNKDFTVEKLYRAAVEMSQVMGVSMEEATNSISQFHQRFNLENGPAQSASHTRRILDELSGVASKQSIKKRKPVKLPVNQTNRQISLEDDE